jgi:phosphate-selective porin OprO and OprP
MKRSILILCSWVALTAQSHAQAPAPVPDDRQGDAAVTATPEELEQRVRVLERKLELANEQAEGAAKSQPQAVAGKDGFEVKSADGAYRLKLRGYLQVDGRWFPDDEELPASDSWVVRRARPIVEGTLFKFVDFRIMPDFGGGSTALFDAYLEAKFSKAARLRVGKFKPPVGLERLQSATDLPFVERGFPTNLVPSRDIGIQLGGELAGGKLEYQAGLFNGVVDGSLADQDSADGKEAAARLVWKPFQPADGSLPRFDLALGLAVTRGDEEGSLTATGLPSFRNQGSSSYFAYRSDATLAGTVRADGTRQRLAPQASFYTGPFGALAEWVSSEAEVRRNLDVAELSHEAWQLQLSWVLTGETNSFRGVVPRRPFSPESRGPGAWIVAVRASGFEADPATFPTFADPARAVHEATLFGAALSWNLIRGVRWMLDYSLVRYEGGAAGGADRPDERSLFARFQISY